MQEERGYTDFTCSVPRVRSTPPLWPLYRVAQKDSQRPEFGSENISAQVLQKATRVCLSGPPPPKLTMVNTAKILSSSRACEAAIR